MVWISWAVGILISLVGLDHRVVARITPRVTDTVVPIAGQVGLMLLLIVPFDPSRSSGDLAFIGATVTLTLLAVRGLVGAAVRTAYVTSGFETRPLS